MTDFLESVRPAEPDATAGPSVRQLLTELAALEDVVRAARSVDDPEALAATARELAIIEELRRRTPAPDDTAAARSPGDELDRIEVRN